MWCGGLRVSMTPSTNYEKDVEKRHQRTLFIQLIYSCFSRYLVPTNSVAPSSVYKAYTTHNSSICSDEGLTLETSAFQSPYGGQFTLSTPLINQIFMIQLSMVSENKPGPKFCNSNFELYFCSSFIVIKIHVSLCLLREKHKIKTRRETCFFF